MASGSSQSSEQRSRPSEPIFGSPLGPVFNNLFGVPMRFDSRRGGFEVGGQPGTRLNDNLSEYQRALSINPFNGAGSIFGPGGGDQGTGRDFANQLFFTDTFDVLGDQLQPTGNAPADSFAGMAQTGLEQALSLFDNSIFPALTELTETGFRTDMDPIRDQAMRQFQREFLPGLAEQYSFLGGGGQTLSSDFGAAAAGAGADMFTDLGAFQTELDEAASGRRMAGLELGSLLGRERTALPLEAGPAIRDEELAARPGGQLLSFIQQLMDIEREPIVQANISTGDSKGSSFTAL